MTKREFVKLKKGDILLVIRHLLNKDGQILVAENSEWRVEQIEIQPLKNQNEKNLRLVHLFNDQNQQSLTISKDSSVNFVIYKRKRGPLPRE